MEGHTAYICMLSVYRFRMELFFFFSIHKPHTFTRPDIFCKVWKSLGDAVPTGKLLFLPIRLRDVNVLISWRTKFRLKVTCLFPCTVEGGWFVRSYKMKQFTRHTFRTKCNINFHHFFLKIGQHHNTHVSDHLHPHLPYVSCSLWRLEDMKFQFLHFLFLFFL